MISWFYKIITVFILFLPFILQGSCNENLMFYINEGEVINVLLILKPCKRKNKFKAHNSELAQFRKHINADITYSACSHRTVVYLIFFQVLIYESSKVSKSITLTCVIFKLPASKIKRHEVIILSVCLFPIPIC